MAKDVQLGQVEAEFNEKLVNYSKLIGKSKIQLIEELFNKETEGKILTNDYILINEVFYFNFLDLQKNKRVKATKEPDSTANLINICIVKKIPNNLDVFDKTKRTFCYNGVTNKHKGVYSYNFIFLNKDKPKDSKLLQDYLLFEYDSETEELFISLTTIDNIELMLDVTEAEDIISDLLFFNKQYTEAFKNLKEAPEDIEFLAPEGIQFLDYINIGLLLTSMLVIEPLPQAKLFASSIFKKKPDVYDKIKGKYNSKDLILYRNINYIESDDSKQ